MGPTIPGRSSISVAVGSDGYRGTSFSTSERIKGTDLVFSLAARWEQGEWFYSDLDYELSTISPSLSWSNGTTSVFLGVEISEFGLSSNQQPRVRPRIDSGPFKSAAQMNRSSRSDFEYSAINLGVTLPILDNTQLFFSAGDHFFNQGGSIGMFHRLDDLNLLFDRRR